MFYTITPLAGRWEAVVWRETSDGRVERVSRSFQAPWLGGFWFATRVMEFMTRPR